MECIMLSRGAPPVIGLELTISGDFSASYAYVTIAGAQYTSAQTLTLSPGDEVSVYVGSKAQCEVTLNGTVVQDGAGTYTFAISAPTQIALTRKAVRQYTAAITTT